MFPLIFALFLWISALGDRPYTDRLCEKALAHWYDVGNVKNDWKNWLRNGDVRITCIDPTLTHPQRTYLTENNVGQKKDWKECQFVFKKGAKKLSAVAELLQGLHHSEIFPEVESFGKKHDVKVEFGDFEFDFKFKFTGKRCGRQLMLTLGGKEKTYVTLNGDIDKLLLPKQSDIENKKLFAFMATTVRERWWNERTNRISQWKQSDVKTKNRHEATKALLNYYFLIWVAESALPQGVQLRHYIEACKRNKTGGTIQEKVIHDLKWLVQPSGRMPEITYKFFEVQKKFYEEEAKKKDGGDPTFKNLMAYGENNGLLFYADGGTKMQRVQFFSDLFNKKWPKQVVMRVSKVYAPPQPRQCKCDPGNLDPSQQQQQSAAQGMMTRLRTATLQATMNNQQGVVTRAQSRMRDQTGRGRGAGASANPRGQTGTGRGAGASANPRGQTGTGRGAGASANPRGQTGTGVVTRSQSQAGTGGGAAASSNP